MFSCSLLKQYLIFGVTLGSTVTFTVSIRLHPRSLRACAEPRKAPAHRGKALLLLHLTCAPPLGAVYEGSRLANTPVAFIEVFCRINRLATLWRSAVVDVRVQNSDRAVQLSTAGDVRVQSSDRKIQLSVVTSATGYLYLSSTCVRWCVLMKNEEQSQQTHQTYWIRKAGTCNNYTSN